MTERGPLDDVRARVMQQAQGAMALNLAFIGVANQLFDALAGAASVAELGARTGLDAGYLERWCEAAYAFGYLDAEAERYDVGFITSTQLFAEGTEAVVTGLKRA